MITLYGYKKCSTCRKSEKFLQANNIEFKYIDITEAPPSKTTLKKMLGQTETPWQKFFNTSGVLYREMKIKDKIKAMTPTEALELLSQNGRLIKRPLITDGSNTLVGFKEEEWKGLFLD